MRRIKRSIMGLAAVLLLTFGAGMTALAAFNTETRESVAVVHISVDLDTGEDLRLGWGTGFFVGIEGEHPQYLITNYHVIEDFVEYGSGNLMNFTVNGMEATGRSKIRVYYDSEDYEEAYLVNGDETKDIALLKLNAGTSQRKPVSLCSPTDDMVGSAVYAVGYPGLSENIFASATSSWSDSDSSVTSGSISRIFTQSGTGTRNIQIDCEIQPGNSGGPLVNDDGAVIGVNAWSVERKDNSASLNYAISIEEVIPMLNVYGVEYTMYGQQTEVPADSQAVESTGAAETESSETGISEADRLENEEQKTAETPETDEPEAESASMLPVAIAIVIAAAIAGAAAVIVSGNRKKKAAAQQPVPPAPVPEPVQRPFVRSLAAQHGGQRVPVGEQIVIGRSRTDCALVFQEGTAGVSGRHCSLAWNAGTGELILTDLNSTYGTYLQNGQRLTPGTPYRLRPGDHFYLGESANMLSVEMG
ncbi:MAG: trypsin-like peptidase domain-containing protein [Eubacteriales bacterium]|nr:trypsin-like peptidase domain-containing protein [Eubacteriales bacterium]